MEEESFVVDCKTGSVPLWVGRIMLTKPITREMKLRMAGTTNPGPKAISLMQFMRALL